MYGVVLVQLHAMPLTNLFFIFFSSDEGGGMLFYLFYFPYLSYPCIVTEIKLLLRVLNLIQLNLKNLDRNIIIFSLTLVNIHVCLVMQ